MTLSDCCGAATRAEYRPDHPLVYDDLYDLQIPVLVCTNCGKAIGVQSIQSRADQSLSGDETLM